MAILRFGALCFGGAMLLATAQRAMAQEPVPDPPAAKSPSAADFDKLAAEAKADQAAKDAAAAKQAPQGAPAADATPAAGTPAAATITATDGTATPAAADATIPPCPAPAPATAPAPAAAAAVTPAGDSPALAADGTVLPPNCKKPVLRFDKKGRLIKEKEKKEKPPKLVPVTVVKGALTVDGLIAKADLNFEILDLQYFYIWVPGMGTAIVSNHPFPGSKLEIDALSGSVLTVKVDDHQLQLAGDRDFLSGKKPKPLSLYVGIDRTYEHGSIYPEFGYGNVGKPPYNWPGTLADAAPTKAPPLPDNLKQKTQAVKTCTKNPDGTEGTCRTVEIPMVISKKS